MVMQALPNGYSIGVAHLNPGGWLKIQDGPFVHDSHLTWECQRGRLEIRGPQVCFRPASGGRFAFEFRDGRWFGKPAGLRAWLTTEWLRKPAGNAA